MSRHGRAVHETKIVRARRSFFLKLVVWIFIGIFSLTVVGGIFVIGASLAAH
ncbi:MAG: hypothetical protein ACYDGM_03890 [Vulcanimicrobiaceae bacterium]